MSGIRFDYSKVAEKFFVKHENIRESFKKDVSKLIKNDHPEQVNFKNLKGKFKGYSRIAINGYRIVYRQLTEDVLVVVSVIFAGARGDIYKHLH